MISLIFLGITFFIQLFAASWYDLAQKTSDEQKVFKHKMICSGIYIADVLLCSGISKDFTSVYSLIFIAAYLLLFASDVSEVKIKSKGLLVSSVIKTVSYAGLTAAFIYQNFTLFKQLFLQRLLINIIVSVIIIAVITIITIKLKKKAYIPLAISSVLMMIQAIILGIPLQVSPVAINQTASCAIIMGTIAIAFSSMLFIFDSQNKKSLMKTNLYYFGLMFTACSIAIL